MEEYVIILPTEMFNTLQHNPQFKITGLKRLLFIKIMRVLKYKKGIQNMAVNYEGVLCQIHGWPKRKQKQDNTQYEE